MAAANWIRFVHSQEHIKEILDYCAEEKKEEREKVLDELYNELKYGGIYALVTKLDTLRQEGKDGE